MNSKRIAILNKQISKLEAYIPLFDEENTTVSKSTIGWQLDHALKVFNMTSEWTENSNPKNYKRKFNFWRSVLFPINYFPRGKVRAPKVVQPPQIILIEDIKSQIHAARTHIENLNKLPKTAYFKHFIFGDLSKKQTLRFLQMHTHHHLKIISDILKK
ncbi:Protein of unknown function [Flaviramulus basaltis]|uniref:DinB superfamily protein n=1 Tax=Flaviramulus basaltis TaxID=369401 RepID=A0A1K2IB63_9FLAO|nr:DUF1569 domain-containing protein [Flaviramulus basaltis]SFZ89660.1 Protein of unknown function [Flaviramulus basaltis]